MLRVSRPRDERFPSRTCETLKNPQEAGKAQTATDSAIALGEQRWKRLLDRARVDNCGLQRVNYDYPLQRRSTSPSCRGPYSCDASVRDQDRKLGHC
jgi:hypothetical protein